MKKILSLGAILLAAMFQALAISAQTLDVYRIFDNAGNEVTFRQMVDSLSRADAVFIGENHNCPVSHWMELKITEALYDAHGNDLVIGEEMMEADNQLILDEYLSRKISYDRFEAEARLWDNYATDYYPVVYFAKENSIPFIATNVPRRYANAVSENGLAALSGLSTEAKSYLAPLPIPFSYDEDDTNDKFGAMRMLSRRSPEEMRHLAEAQALKDATMGWFISRNMKNNTKFVHINGTMHSDWREGIVPYLLHYRPATKIATVTSVRQESIDSLEDVNKDRADFYIVVDETFPTSY